MKKTHKTGRVNNSKKWFDYKNPVPTTPAERRMWEQKMIEDSNRTLLPKFQH